MMLKSYLKFSAVIGLCLIVASAGMFAQRGKGPGAKEKIATMKKVKLLEILDLDEKASDAFLAKYTSWENKIEESRMELDKSMDELEKSLKSGDSKEAITEKTEAVRKKQKEFADMLFNAQTDIKSILGETNFAKYVLFEHKFREELQKQIMKRMGKRKNRDYDR